MSKKAAPQSAKPNSPNGLLNAKGAAIKAAVLAQHHGKVNTVDLLDPEEHLNQEEVAILDEETSGGVAERIILAQSGGAASDAAPASAATATAANAATGEAATGGAVAAATTDAALLAVAGLGVIGIAAAAGGGGGGGSAAPAADTTPPAAPVINPVAGDNIINAAETGTTITGTAEANSTVNLTVGAGNLRTVTTNATGNWSYTLVPADIAAMGEGAETLSATATDAAGNVSAAGTRAITADTVAPTVTDARISITSTGSGTTGSYIVGDTITVQWDNSAAGDNNADVAGVTMDFSNVGGGTAVAATETAPGSGIWTASYVIAAGSANNVGLNVSVTATDTAGNATTTTDTTGLNVDAVPPAAPALALAVDTGVAGDGITSNGQVNVTGLEAGATWEYSTDGGTTWMAGAGSSVTLTGDGAQSVIVRQTDVAGNASPNSAALSFTLDTTPPAATATIDAVSDNVVPVIWSLPSGTPTNDTSLDLSGTIIGVLGVGEVVAVYDGAARLGEATVAGANWTYTDTMLANGDVVSYTVRVEDAAGNQGTASPAFTTTIDTAPPAAPGIDMVAGDDIISATETGATITGTAEANAVVVLLLGAGNYRPVSADAAGVWSYTLQAADITAMGEGTEAISAYAGDAAGNASATTTRNITVDTVAAPPVIDMVAGDDYISNAEYLAGTSVSGTAEPGSTVNLKLGVGNVRAITVAGDGSWSYALQPADFGFMNEGSETISAIATDVAGNVSVAGTRNITIDTIAPTVSDANISVTSIGNGTGGVYIVGDTVTAQWDNSPAGDNNPDVAGVTMDFSAFGGGTAVATETLPGIWTASYVIAAGTINNVTGLNVAVTATDAAGNPATTADTSGLTVDNQVPAAPVIDMVAGDDVINAAETGTAITGTAEAGSTVNLSLGGNTRTATADGITGVWSYTLQAADITAMGEGPEMLSATAADAAGNVSTAGTRNITLDTVAPAAPAIDMVAIDDIINAAETGTAVTGTAEAGSTVNLTLGGNTRTVTADGTGNWSYSLVPADIAAMGEGAETLSATATDAAGNVSTAGTRNITLDTVAPAAPAIGMVAGDDIINALEQAAAITGTAEANSTVNLTLGGNTRTATADGITGVWSYTLQAADITAMGEGPETLSATATDAAGNVSAATTRGIMVDTVVSATSMPNLLSNSGSTADNITYVTIPTFGGAGAEAGATVTLLEGATVLGTATADGTGAWTITSTALTNGVHNISASQTDVAGNVSAASAALAVTIDTVAPTATDANISIISTGSGTGGTYIAGDTVTAQWDNSALGDNNPDVAAVMMNFGDFDGPFVAATETAPGSGIWTASYTIAEGSINGLSGRNVAADVWDIAGNGGWVNDTTGLTVDNQTPAVPVINPVAGDDLISLAEYTAGASVSGTAEAGSTVNLTLGIGNVHTVTVDAGGNWSYALVAADFAAMNEGSETISATVTDAAGNVSAAATRNITIDTIPPMITDANISITSTGSGTGGAYLAGDTVTAQWNNSAGGDNNPDVASATMDFSAFGGGAAVAATQTAPGPGIWTASYTIAAGILNGVTGLNVVVTATDTAGNAGTMADSTGLTVDNQVPAAPVINLVAGDNIINLAEAGSAITGTAEANAIVNLTVGAGNVRTMTADGAGVWSYTLVGADITAMGEGAETLSATATDAAGNVSAAGVRAITIDTVRPSAPTINQIAGDGIINASETGVALTGTAEANSTVNLTFGGNTRTVTADGTGSWTYTLVGADITGMGEGPEVVTAFATDAAGNVSSTPGMRLFTVDTVAPAAPVIDMVAGDDIINAAETGAAITGTAEANSTVNLTVGAGNIRTVTADGTGNWSYTLVPSEVISLAGMGQGPQTLSATATDAAGNVSVAGTRDIMVDTVAPAVPAIDIVAGDDIINAAETGTAITGITASAGSTVNLTLGGNTRTVLTDGSGVWSYTLQAADITAMGEGPEMLSATATDAAGNVSTAATRNITVDTIVPTATASIAAVTDNMGFYTGALNPGNSTDDTSLDLTGTITGELGAGEAVVVYDGATRLGEAAVVGSNWAYTDTSLATGDLVSYTVRVEDAAGNQGAASPAPGAPIRINTVTPTITDANISISSSGSGTGGTYLVGDTVTAQWDNSVAGDNNPEYLSFVKMDFSAFGGGAAVSATQTLPGVWTASYAIAAGSLNGVGGLNVAVTAMDTTGNVNTVADTTGLTVDNQAPAAPTLALVADTGGAADSITSNGQVNVTGLEPGAAWEYSVDAGTTWTAGTGSSFTLAGDGAYGVIARQTDTAGNVSAASAPLTVTIDTVAVAPSIVLDPASDSGALGDNVTNVTTPTFTGTAEPGATVTLFDGSNVLGPAVADGAGNWSIACSWLADGMHNVSASQIDVAGNPSMASTPLAVTIDSWAPYPLDADFVNTGGITAFSAYYSETITATGPGGVAALQNGITPLTIIDAAPSTTTDPDDTITLSFIGATLAANDYVVLNYDAALGSVADLGGNPAPSGTMVFGSAGTLGAAGTTINLTANPLTGFPLSPWTFIYTHQGNDTVTGSSGMDWIRTGNGSDTINGSGGMDVIDLTETTPATDTVVLQQGMSGYMSFDEIYGFDVNAGASNDRLDVRSNNIAAPTGNVNGANVGTVWSHSIGADGIVTFAGDDGGAMPVLIDWSNVGDALIYLRTNLTHPGETVAFSVDYDGDGLNDSLFVYQNAAGWDLVARLDGIPNATLGIAAGTNVVQLWDHASPEIEGASFAENTISLDFSEDIQNLWVGTQGTILLNGTGGDIKTEGLITGNVLDITSSVTLSQSDWLLFTTGSDFGDLNGNPTVAGQVFAFGGSGDNTIDVTGLAPVNRIMGNAGNDTLTGTANTEVLVGGTEADTINSGGGLDTFSFAQGDSTPVTYLDVNGNGAVDNGDTFTFTGGADIINSAAVGSSIVLETLNDTTVNMSWGTLSATGQIGDQQYDAVRGDYAAGVFTVNNAVPTAMLGIYDGDPTAGVTQTALVLSGNHVLNPVDNQITIVV